MVLPGAKESPSPVPPDYGEPCPEHTPRRIPDKAVPPRSAVTKQSGPAAGADCTAVSCHRRHGSIWSDRVSEMHLAVDNCPSVHRV